MRHRRHFVSVSWTDHLAFGRGDARLATPEALARRFAAWRDELGAGTVLWRLHRRHVPGRYQAGRGARHPIRDAARSIGWDDLALVPRLAHGAGLKAYLYVSLFDEGWPLPPPRVRTASYHNADHLRAASWQSDFSRLHPEYAVADRTGRRRQWGVLCLSVPRVRAHFRERFGGLLARGDFDGLFVCLRSQSRPADHADQFGHNVPMKGDDLQAWRDRRGAFLTRFLEELRAAVKLRLAVGAPWGDVVGPPMGNMTLAWPDWVARGLVDDLVVGQDSTRCPSLGHRLWPMHRGRGYLTVDLPPAERLRAIYAPVVAGSRTALYVARQWDPRSAHVERELLTIPGVRGLVFSSFRHDH
jgi:hypothetical protein